MKSKGSRISAISSRRIRRRPGLGRIKRAPLIPKYSRPRYIERLRRHSNGRRNDITPWINTIIINIIIIIFFFFHATAPAPRNHFCSCSVGDHQSNQNFALKAARRETGPLSRLHQNWTFDPNGSAARPDCAKPVGGWIYRPD